MTMNFKFLRGKPKVDWGHSGLLDGCDNEPLLIRVLDITRNYLMDNNLLNGDYVLIFPIVRRIWYNKVMDYSDEEIRDNVIEYVEYLGSEELRTLMIKLLADAFMTVDIEAEIVNVVSDYFNWNE
jgi:hypothetical protein